MKNIVIVDDDASINLIMNKYLSAIFPEATIKSYTSGFKFMADFESLTADLIIMDIHLVDIKGTDIILKIKDLSKNIPIWVMSGSIYDRSDLPLEVQRLVVGIFTKPITKEKLREKLIG